MASSASAAALLPLPLPSCSSSEDSDDGKHLPSPPALEANTSPAQQQKQKQKRRRQERDYNVAMKALALDGDVDEVVAVFAELKRTAGEGGDGGPPPNVLCYNTLANALAEAGREGEALKAFDEMLASGVAPNASSQNILIKMHARRLEFDLAWELIHKSGVEPDVGTYSTLIAGLCRAGKVVEAWGVLDWMLEKNCRPMVQTYTPIVQAYCRDGRIVEAKLLMAEMERLGCLPNVVTYNVLIRALCDGDRFDEVEQVLMESSTKDWKPSTVTYNIYMNGLCKKGKAKEALKLLDVMLGEGLEPTAYTSSILLNCLCHSSRLLDAIYLLGRSTELKWYAGVVAYNTVMSSLCEMGKWRGIMKLLTDMIKKGIEPNTRTFNILVRSLCVGGKFSLAKSLIHSQGFAANVVTYNTLLHWFYYRGKLTEANRLISVMLENNVAPDEVTYTIIIVGLCREGKFDAATAYFLKSLTSGLSMDVLTVLLNRLVYADKIWEINRIFDGKDFVPDYHVFDLTIRTFCRAGYCHYRTFYKLNLILDTMLKRKGLTAASPLVHRYCHCCLLPIASATAFYLAPSLPLLPFGVFRSFAKVYNIEAKARNKPETHPPLPKAYSPTLPPCSLPQKHRFNVLHAQPTWTGATDVVFFALL
uniref:Pentacotripeptide-repeat region of PRORP domain-containing protein n=1 Tax=Oryza punctata TaxID=4537 RepID=A0A0E0JZ55_ORYPU